MPSQRKESIALPEVRAKVVLDWQYVDDLSQVALFDRHLVVESLKELVETDET